MKNFMKPQSFVWVTNIAISVWNINTYYHFNQEKNRVLRDCSANTMSTDEARLCGLLIIFDTVPLPDVWVSFILDTTVQTGEIQTFSG